MPRKGLLEHPLPRVEFEQVLDRFESIVDERLAIRVVPYLGHVQEMRLDASLGCRIAHVGHVAIVLFVSVGGCEMNPIPALLTQVSPGFDQLFMKAVELIECGNRAPFGLHRFEPMPLHHRGLEQ